MLTKLSDMGELLGTILDVIPASIFMVNEDVKILGVNQKALLMLSQDPESVIRRPAGEVLHCIHSTETAGGCGTAEACRECRVRAAVGKSFRDNQVVRHKVQMELVSEGGVNPVSLLITTAPFEFQQKIFVLLILEDISELMDLMDLLPVCARCKEVMDASQIRQCMKQQLKEKFKVVCPDQLCAKCMVNLIMEGEKF